MGANNTPNAAGTRDVHFSSVVKEKKSFRYMSKMEQSIMISIAAKKNAKMREWMEAEAERKQKRIEKITAGEDTAAMQAEAERESKKNLEELKGKGVNIEVPDFLKSIYKERPFLS